MKYGILTFPDPVPKTDRKILHVDMDAFYASVEIRDNPSLANQAVVIAKHPNLTGGRGIVTTCNYIARTYGIHSAMSAMEAYRRCPKAVFIQGNMAYYRQVSGQIRQIFNRYTDLIEPLSLDEAYLDVTDNKVGAKSALYLAQEIQATIYKELRLTCSIGVSYNKFIAKIASDFKKPAGITLVRPQEGQAFLMALPIEKFYGVGRKSVDHYKALGIHTGSDLYEKDLEFLIKHFGKTGQALFYRVRGVDDRPVNPVRNRKSIGRERTFQEFIVDDPSRIMLTLERLTKSVHQTLLQQKRYTGLVTIKWRYDDFETVTRQSLLKRPTDQWQDIWTAVSQLWQVHGQGSRPVRLLGVSLGHLINPEKDAIQLTIDERSEEDWHISPN